MDNENREPGRLELEPMELVACEGGGVGNEDGLSGEGDLFTSRIEFPADHVEDLYKTPIPLTPLSAETRALLEAAGFELEE